MMDKNLDETQPNDSFLGDTQPAAAKPNLAEQALPERKQPQPGKGVKSSSKFASPLIGALLFSFALLFIITVSSVIGYGSGSLAANATNTAAAFEYQAIQFNLSSEDFNAGRYLLARQRLEFILASNPDFPGAANLLEGVNANLQGVSGSLPAGTPTQTSTPDLRPVEDLYNQALAYTYERNWDLALQTLANLRASDTTYRILEVDGLIYLSLRNRGFDKILNRGELEGGLYDFSLAEQFGPLDSEAQNFRDLARLYMIGNSFWGAYPETAAYYYGQVAAAAPNLHDATGMGAFFRYWWSLLQHADNLAASGEWCPASEQYGFALASRMDVKVGATATAAFLQCITPTPTITPTFTQDLTSSPTGELTTATFTLTPTNTIPAVGDTLTPSPTASITPTASNTTEAATPTFTDTSTPVPPSPTSTPTP